MQAFDQGMLQGHCNTVQIIAASFVRIYKDSIEREREKTRMKFSASMFDNWLMFEHYDAWEYVMRARKEKDDGFDEIKLDEMSADTMDEMIEKMRRAATMFDVSNG